MRKIFSPNHLLALVAFALTTAGSSLASHNHSNIPHNHKHLARRQTVQQNIPSNWVQHSVAKPHDPVEFTLALKGQHMNNLSNKMDEIAEKGDGSWLSDEELDHYVRPAPEHKRTLEKYLAQHDVKTPNVTWSKYGDHAKVSVTAGTASKMFNQTNMYRYNDTSTGQMHIKTHQALHIPSHLSFVEHVSNLNMFPPSLIARPAQPLPAAAAQQLAQHHGCNASHVTGKCIRKLYGVNKFKPKGNKTAGPAVLIMGYMGQYASQHDLRSYLNQFGVNATKDGHVNITSAGKPNNPRIPGKEAMLDIELATVVNHPLQNTFLSFSGHDDAYADSLQYVLDKGIKPGVISISYGIAEKYLNPSSAQRACSVVQKLTAQGTTVIAGSGDNGVNDVQHKGAGHCSYGFVPTFPSTCPFILSVGATKNPKQGNETAPAWSGGGFSNYFPRPKYQAALVPPYVQHLGKMDGKYNMLGRAYPDVAAIGQMVVVVANKTSHTVFGTSASTPIWAGLVSLANDARHAAGKGNIGYIHNTLYQNSSSFNDVTIGKSAGCGGAPPTRRSLLTARTLKEGAGSTPAPPPDSGSGSKPAPPPDSGSKPAPPPGSGSKPAPPPDSGSKPAPPPGSGSKPAPPPGSGSGTGSKGNDTLGFPAVKGYDAVTGLGSIQIDKLVSLLMGPNRPNGGQPGPAKASNDDCDSNSGGNSESSPDNSSSSGIETKDDSGSGLKAGH